MKTRHKLSLLKRSTSYSELAHDQIHSFCLLLLATYPGTSRCKSSSQKAESSSPPLPCNKLHTDRRTPTMMTTKGSNSWGSFSNKTYPLISTCDFHPIPIFRDLTPHLQPSTCQFRRSTIFLLTRVNITKIQRFPCLSKDLTSHLQSLTHQFLLLSWRVT